MSRKDPAAVVPCPSHTEVGWCAFCGTDGVWFQCPVHHRRLSIAGYCEACRFYYNTKPHTKEAQP